MFEGSVPRDGFRPKHLVALYARLHARVYGAEPQELADGKSFFAASSAAERLVRVEFAGTPDRALDFLRWTWRREADREKWRRQNPGGSGGGRIGWKLQFAGRALVTDYRVEMARRSEFSSHR